MSTKYLALLLSLLLAISCANAKTLQDNKMIALSEKDNVSNNQWEYTAAHFSAPTVYNSVDNSNVIVTLSLFDRQCDISKLELNAFYKAKNPESEFDVQTGASLKFNDRLFSAPLKAIKRKQNDYIHFSFDLGNVHRPTFFDYLSSADKFSIFWIDSNHQASSINLKQTQFKKSVEELLRDCSK